MKKYIIFSCFFVMLTFTASSLVATYTGDLDKYGKGTVSYKIGFASDKKTNIKISIPDVNGLNLTYIENETFDPENSSKTIYRDGQNIPVQEFFIDVKPSSDAKKVYNVPVTFEASEIVENDNETASKVVQEREYTFKYIYQGSKETRNNLLNINNQSSNTNDRINKSATKGKASINNSNSPNNQDENQEQKQDNTTVLLLFGVLTIFSYVFYEVLS